jgi:hypothetical protein
MDWSRPLAYVWALGLGAGWVASMIVVSLLRARGPVGAQLPPTPRAVRWIPVFIALLTVPVGALMFFFPEIGRARWPWDLANAINVRLFGALFLSVGAAALWSWRLPSWYGYDVLYPGAATFSIVALVAALLHWPLFEGHPVAKWIFVVVYFLAGVLGYYPWVRFTLPRA